MWRDSNRGAAGRRLGSLGWLLFCALVAPKPGELGYAQDLILLRDTNVIRDRTVASLDPDGLHLDDGRVIGWGKVERARVSAELQPQVNKALVELGGPLFRIGQRLKVGDYAGVLEPASAVHAQFLTRASESGLMVSQALMWGRLQAGQRESALLAHLETYAKLKVRPQLADTLPGKRPPRIDMDTALSRELAPVWFDRAAAAKVKPDLLALAAKLPAPRPDGVYIYCATLCQAAGDQATAARMIQACTEQRGKQWQLILEAQAEIDQGAPGSAVQRLRLSVGQLHADDRPVALYWLSRAQMASKSPPPGDKAALSMLSIAAVYGESHPELAAAALHHTMQYFADREQAAESIRVRRELLERFGQTFYARLASQPQPP